MANKQIPIYPLSNLSDNEHENSPVFFLTQKVENPKYAVNVPFRSDYFGVGICISGKAEIKANLDTYIVRPNWLVALSPQVIREFTYRSNDYKTISIFFTKDLIGSGSQIATYQFPFFDNSARHAFKLNSKDSKLVRSTLIFLKLKYDTTHRYRDIILKNGIAILLHEVAAIYQHQNSLKFPQTRMHLIRSEFKKLVNDNCTVSRSVQFYAEQLSITRKYLSETIKETTGKTAGRLIAEALVLEAKILLQNPSLSIGQISDLLHFSDQSTFGKYFKNSTGLSPNEYRSRL